MVFLPALSAAYIDLSLLAVTGMGGARQLSLTGCRLLVSF
jgi:hypothetical protein